MITLTIVGAILIVCVLLGASKNVTALIIMLYLGVGLFVFGGFLICAKHSEYIKTSINYFIQHF